MNNVGRAMAVAMVLAGLAADGCGSGGGQGGGAIKAVDINAMPRDQVKQGGKLTIAIEEFPTQYNASHLDGPNGSTSQVLGPLMPGLFNFDEKGRPMPNTDYLQSATVTASRPRQVITYRLNPKARWNDGQPITWREFEAEWKALSSPNGPYSIASSTGYERVQSVTRGRDDYEVIVTFKRPYSDWQGLFSVYPKETNSDPKIFNKGWLNKIPKSAGPFKLGSIDRTGQTITLVRDPKWWGRPAKLDSMVFRALDHKAAINAFVSGEVDAVDVGPEPSDFQRVKRVPGGAVREAAGPDFRHITFNSTSPFLKDVNVRRAIAMAIDRQTLARADLVKLNWPAKVLDNHFLVNTQEGYQANSGEVGKFNPARSKQLLDQAGWRMGPTPFRRKDGKELKLRFVIPSDVAVSRQEGLLAQRMLRSVGVNLDLVTVPSNDFFIKYITPGSFDVAPFSWLGTPFPVSSASSIYQEPVKGEIQQNYARVGSPEIDKLMDEAQDQTDLAQARARLNRADALIWDEVHSITLYQRPNITAVKATVANYGSSGFQTTPVEDIGYAK